MGVVGEGAGVRVGSGVGAGLGVAGEGAGVRVGYGVDVGAVGCGLDGITNLTQAPTKAALIIRNININLRMVNIWLLAAARVSYSVTHVPVFGKCLQWEQSSIEQS
jgi:hypothetical protein